jgi:hypothetical protein
MVYICEQLIVFSTKREGGPGSGGGREVLLLTAMDAD